MPQAVTAATYSCLAIQHQALGERACPVATRLGGFGSSAPRLSGTAADRGRVKLYDAADCSGTRAADGAELLNFLLPSPLSSPSSALQLFSPGGPGSARRDQRRSSRTPAFPDLSFSPFFARSGNPAGPQVGFLCVPDTALDTTPPSAANSASLTANATAQGRQEVRVKEESGCSQQLGQPTPAQPSQPEQPTRGQRRRALNFSQPGPPALAAAAEQPGFMHSRVPYGEVRLHSCRDLAALQQTCCVCSTCMVHHKGCP